jgi:diguanylate cyclase (GGDEF)-like protein/PAS domain S-box-containing protein
MSDFQNHPEPLITPKVLSGRSGARSHNDEIARLSRLADALLNAGDESTLVATLLEKLSVLETIPYCALFEWDGSAFSCLNEHGSVAGATAARLLISKPADHASSPRPAPGEVPPHTLSFTSPAFRPTAVVSLPFSVATGHRLLLFADDRRTHEELRSLLPFLQEVARIAAFRLEHLRLVRRLESIAHEFEIKVAERTEELARANRALESEIAERHRTKIALRQAAAVFENTTEAVLITDPSERILWVNRAFTDVTGYTSEEAVGQTPRLLRSGRHDAAFYNAMWETIQKAGHWKGEIWNRRKDGTVYPELLNVTAVKNEGGETTHFVALFSDISATRDSQTRIERLAHYDPLTDLPNRLLFRARLEHAAGQAKRHGQKLGVLILGVDGFKALNQTLGLPAGDELLRAVARILSESARDGDTVARLAGDEFVVLVENLDDAQTAASVARRTLETLARLFEIEGRELFVTCSGGMSVYPDDGDDLAELLRNAHTAFHRAKQFGRNSYQFYTADMRVRADERFAIESDLRHALERNELTLHFQPQFSLPTGECVGFEALSRWNHPERGFLLPKSFIPIAEESGAIEGIGAWALAEACRQVVRWQAAGIRPCRVSVNLCAREITRTDLRDTVARALRDSGLTPESLELEITEGSLLEHPEEVFKTLRSLKDLGVSLAIDDFGTGYSSLSYLKHLPVDKLKIDRSFVRDISIDPHDAAIARTIITLAHGLHLKVVAEGVERKEQAVFLEENGCDEVQGFLYGRPMPPEEVPLFLSARR